MTDYSETYIDNAAKDTFLGDRPENPITLEEAFLITKQESNLKSLEKHPDPLFNSRFLTRNHKRK